jgi:hypothetical protein
MPQKKARVFYLAFQPIKNIHTNGNKHSIYCTSLNHKCARAKILIFLRTKNAQMEFLKMLGTDFE